MRFLDRVILGESHSSLRIYSSTGRIEFLPGTGTGTGTKGLPVAGDRNDSRWCDRVPKPVDGMASDQ